MPDCTVADRHRRAQPRAGCRFENPTFHIKIEVVRGPNAASYGANSFMRVINIITRHSAVQQGSSLSLAAGRNREEATAHHGGRNGDLTWRISASLRKDQGEDTEIHNSTNQSFVWTRNKFDDKDIRQIGFRDGRRG